MHSAASLCRESARLITYLRRKGVLGSHLVSSNFSWCV
jgi:hypothetical protein